VAFCASGSVFWKTPGHFWKTSDYTSVALERFEFVLDDIWKSVDNILKTVGYFTPSIDENSFTVRNDRHPVSNYMLTIGECVLDLDPVFLVQTPPDLNRLETMDPSEGISNIERPDPRHQ
jgi:hypothetical protein